MYNILDTVSDLKNIFDELFRDSHDSFDIPSYL